ncbi:50S ribosome-binding protein YggL [Silvimonas iriomotensis]|uniref:DUF469 family protein n=1 Tax=Silvimonas iriomotensis TaxID=449662 RepID=A0ABQ2P506_9NEIS|nr:50S ribosome-binding protein YggL [Silvimonas iriomotensis]GGP18348.1 hypothetical protein GCM10010970_04480 [Silvimonas iriomotensis]
MSALDAVSRRRISKLNTRQRKKLHVAEFQELGFDVHITFKAALDDAALTAFINDTLDYADSRGWMLGGLGGRLPLAETSAFVCKAARGSLGDADRDALVAWLKARSDVASAEAEGLVDVWHGWLA